MVIESPVPPPVAQDGVALKGMSLRSSMHLDATGKPLKHGGNPKILPRDPALVATLKYKNFAPCCCTCFECFNNPDAKSRTYFKVFENHIEANNPWNPCCCCGPRCCTADWVAHMKFDKMNEVFCCCHLPCVCCGPPVVYVLAPKCCYCIDCEPCCGRSIYHSPCNIHGLRSWLCIGVPCFVICSHQLTGGAKGAGADDWLARFRAAHNAYSDKHNLPSFARTRFYKVVDIGLCDCGSARQIDAYTAEEIPTNDEMER